ncbi:uncharacterized protein DSM5745_02427 [Aspergillus mulundensis]|uniref:Uncharacterized protein n=1 Tax=Aspergillus mulundensis TaxID=1810919 RepID=A0A3D8SWF6_9EURO|nr:hypothetical protein DSM5745_02427 [Aspergillus mulundensis]RDW90652.1 hypothetical protein DSM5745_02427 [Aspergillus mulundensis]
MTRLLPVLSLLLLSLGANASPFATPPSSSNPSTSTTSTLFAFDLPCAELTTLNNNVTPFLNLAVPPGTPNNIVPEVTRRLGAINSFIAAYTGMLNTFNTNNCANTDTGVNMIQARQAPIEDFRAAVCEAVEGADMSALPEEFASMREQWVEAMGCSEGGAGGSSGRF